MFILEDASKLLIPHIEDQSFITHQHCVIALLISLHVQHVVYCYM